MKKIQFYGKLLVKDEWVDLNTDVCQFEIPDETEPFDFFKTLMSDGIYYLISYFEIKE
jgi:hypothetical protein